MLAIPKKYIIISTLVVIPALLFAWGCVKQHVAAADPLQGKADTVTKFANPIKVSDLDPYVTRKDGYYYYLSTGPNYITIKRLQQIIYLSTAYNKTVFTPPGGTAYSANVSKPEMHFLNNKWYIYFTADDGLLLHRRIFALENDSADPLLGSWAFKGAVADTTNDLFESDGTVLEYNNQLYFLWSGLKAVPTSANDIEQQLYIAKMSNPWTISGPRVMISEPTNSWEQYIDNSSPTNPVTYKIDQNPEIIKNPQGNIYLTFTAGTCLSDNVGLGLLSLTPGADPMNPASWTKSAQPVFTTNINGAFGPAFNGFFKSPNGTEDWLIYDANIVPEQGCGTSRSPRIQKFTWNLDGSPNFGTPAGIADTLLRPAR